MLLMRNYYCRILYKRNPLYPTKVYTLAGSFVRSVYGHRKVTGLSSAQPPGTSESSADSSVANANVVLIVVVEAGSSVVSMLQ